MATAQASNVTSAHLECPKCVNEMTQPLLLKCQHYFCKPCVDDFKQITKSSAAGINCPICQTFSSNEDLKKMEFIQELFDAVSKAKAGESLCVSCEKAKPDIRCEDCKDDYCQSCKDTRHDAIPILKNHTWKLCDDKTSTVVDSTLFCEHHPSQVLNLYCVDCEKLVCLICDKEVHGSHQSETVVNALKKIKPNLKTYREEILTMMKNKEECLENVISDAEDIKKNYEDMEVEIDKEYDQIIKTLEHDRKALKKRLSELRTKQTSNIGKVVAFLERTIRLQKNALTLSNTVIDSTEGGSLIQFLKTGVHTTVMSIKGDRTKPNHYQKTPIGKFKPHEIRQENLLGIIKEEVSGSMLIPHNVEILSQAQLSLEKVIPKSFTCFRFIKIDKELWYNKFNSNEIIVFSLDGRKLREMKVDTVSKCRSIVKFDERVLRVTSNGLWLTGMKLANPVRVLEQDMCDISVRQNKVYCLQSNLPKIHVLTYDCDSAELMFDREISFAITIYKKSYGNTIQVASNSIFIGNFEDNTILQLDLNGQLIRSLGPVTHYGQFYRMFLSGVDENDGMLVCDCNNNRILAMASDGAWCKLNLPDISLPTCALVDDGKLYVMQFGGSIKIYTY